MTTERADGIGGGRSTVLHFVVLAPPDDPARLSWRLPGYPIFNLPGGWPTARGVRHA